MTELRHTVRQLLRAPVFTLAAVITLALAIAAAATIFSVYNAVVYRPQLAMNWDGIYRVSQMSARGIFNDLETPQITALQQYRPDPILATASTSVQQVVIQHQHRAIKNYAEIVSGDYGALFRITPQAGRLFDARDNTPGADAAIVSAGLWREWFGGRHDIAEADVIRINGAPFRIVGVMPRGAMTMWGAEVWIPAAARHRIVTAEQVKPPRYSTYVRARPGAAGDQVRAAVAAAVAHAPPSPQGERGLHVFYWGGGRRSFLEAQVYGITALLLLAACANLTNLIYARIAQRRNDIAVRLALGAGRFRVARGFILEILTLTMVAAVAGYAIAAGVLALLARAFPAFRRDEWGMLSDIAPDLTVVLYTAGVAAAAALVLSVVVTLNVGRMMPARMLAASGNVNVTASGGRRFRSVLVAIQVTAAVVLVMGAGLWLVSARREIVRQAAFSDFRYDASKLASVRLDLAFNRYSETRAAAFQPQALDAIRRVPEVQDAALTTGLPGASRGDRTAPSSMYVVADVGERVLAGRPPQVQASYASVSPNFLRTIGLPLVRGRDFTPGDMEGAPLAALVSETLARMLFPKVDPIGQRLYFFNDKKPRTVVGVFRDPLISARERWMVAHNILVLVPVAQYPRSDAMIVVRTDHPAGVAEGVASALTALDPQVAIFDARSVEEALLAESAPVRAVTRAMSALGALSLTFAALGIYGVMSFFVSTRVREFGIRLALGATPFGVMRHVFGEARLLLLFGLLCGVFLMSIAERVLDNRIFRLAPNEISTWLGAIALVLIVGLIAAYFPARRASRTNPTVALRDL